MDRTPRQRQYATSRHPTLESDFPEEARRHGCEGEGDTRSEEIWKQGSRPISERGGRNNIKDVESIVDEDEKGK